MKCELIQSSIVFVQPRESESLGKYFITPTISQEVFPEGFSAHKANINIPHPITVDIDAYSIQEVNDRLVIQITYPKPSNFEELKRPPDDILSITKNIKKLTKDIEHKAIGVNFKVLIRSGSISILNEALSKYAQLLSMKFETERDDLRAINTIQRVTIQDEEGKQPGLIFDTNFHFELSGISKKENRDAVKDILSKRQKCFERLKEIIHECCN